MKSYLVIAYYVGTTKVRRFTVKGSVAKYKQMLRSEGLVRVVSVYEVNGGTEHYRLTDKNQLRTVKTRG